MYTLLIHNLSVIVLRLDEIGECLWFLVTVVCIISVSALYPAVGNLTYGRRGPRCGVRGRGHPLEDQRTPSNNSCHILGSE